MPVIHRVRVDFNIPGHSYSTTKTKRGENPPYETTIGHHLTQFDTTRVVKELQDNLYVDDWLSGADDEAEAMAMVAEAKEVMSQASMVLAKWESNKSMVVDKADTTEFVKVLGLQWHAKEDCFIFEGLELDSSLRVTKRLVLSLIARLFDPLGLLNPFTIGLKCLFQDLWRSGQTWDQEVPDSIEEKVKVWVEGLESLRVWRIPRSYTGGP